MRIAQLCPPWIEVPPETYGGTELIASWLSDELTKRGHQVTLFATGGSKTSAELVETWPTALWRENLSAPHAVFSLMYNKLLERKDDFDIIHDHCEWYTSPFSKFFNTPIVTTLHHPLTEETTILYKKFPNVNYVAISENQKKTGPGINIVETIHHGLPMEKYEFNSDPDDYLLWLSKITPEKGPAEAIELAKAAGEKLILSGYIPPDQGDYFEYRLKPMIDEDQIKFVGASDFKKKIELCKNAEAFLIPIDRPEPFGLVVAEAMACGTPVITTKRGAMPELVIDGKTGFLINSEKEAIKALKKINTISRKECRKHMEENFHLSKMVDQYEKLYKRLINSNGYKKET